MSYETDCEVCGKAMTAAARYCPWCGEEQQRAAERIEEMRNGDSENER